jgi:hypothetical protein
MMLPATTLGAATGTCALPGEAALDSASIAAVAAPANSSGATRTCLLLDGLFVMHHI